MKFQRVIMILLAALLLPALAFAQPAPQGETSTTFTVYKFFSDGNSETPVTVHIQCFTGLPLNQQQTVIADNNGEFEVEFVVENFNQGELDCNIWEGDVAGYTATYDAGSYVGEPTADADGCHFSNIDTSIEKGPAPPAVSFRENGCIITNTPDPVEVTVNKDWVIDGSGGDALDPTYRIALLCSSPIDGGEVCDLASASTSKFGSSVQSEKLPIEACYFKELTPSSGVDSAEDASYTADVIPDWEYGTFCVGAEIVYDSSVEQDTFDCDYEGMVFGIGGEGDTECTITNTVFYEGIPTLSQYGMAIMALLMLGVGFVGFRRFV